MKNDFDASEETWRGGDCPGIVTDPGGVIFLSRRPDWLFRALRPPGPEDRPGPRRHGATLSPLPDACPKLWGVNPTVEATGRTGTEREAGADRRPPAWSRQHWLTIGPTHDAWNGTSALARVWSTTTSAPCSRRIRPRSRGLCCGLPGSPRSRIFRASASRSARRAAPPTPAGRRSSKPLGWRLQTVGLWRAGQFHPRA